MKKIFIITSITLISTILNAQNAGNENSKYRFGLKLTPSINWYVPEGKIISSDGPIVRYGGGLIIEYKLAKVASLQTGIQIDVDGGKIKYNNGGPNNSNSNTISYYYYGLDDIIVKYNAERSSPVSYTHYQLNERAYKVTYVTIPLAIKMKTKEIGALTYYGQIGLNNSFRWKANANDELQVIDDVTNELGTKDSKSKINITQDISIYTAALNFGLGGELNFSGSTSFTFGLSYNLGFTSVVKNDSDYIGRRANNTDFNPSLNPTGYSVSKMPQSIKSNAILINLGVLF